MITAEELLKYNLDAIPKYLLMRDIIKLNKEDKDLKEAKTSILQTRWVEDIVKLQWDDGSWGEFHSMSKFSKNGMTTEQGLRRLLVLGLDYDDQPIQKVLRYMEQYLLGELDLRDRKEKKHDWDLLTRLFVATWIIMIDSSNVLAKKIAADWAKIITYAFSGAKYNHNAYKEAYYEVHKVPKGKYMWGFQNFYIVALLPGYLKYDIESKFLDYIMSSEKGIYYIYDKCLNIEPTDFCSKQANKYINAYDLLSRYPSAGDKLPCFINWVYDNISDDGFWDMGQIAKDNVQYPLSNSWRKALNRKIDCTIRIQRIMSKII